MMQVKITYMDGKDISVTINSEDAKKFFDAVGHHQFYFDDRKGRGFWTDVDKIRHMVVEELPDAQRENKKAPANSQGNQEGSHERPATGCGSDGMDAKPEALDEVEPGEKEAQ